MKKEIVIGIIINTIFFVLISIANYNFITLDITPYITKTIASILFLLCGLFNLIYIIIVKNNEYRKFAIIMVVGLAFACAGDILLIDFFPVGAASFAIGHIFYFAAFCVLSKVHWLDIAIGGGIFAASLLLLLLYPFEFNGMLPLVIPYALIISLMLGKAVSNLFVKSKNRLLNIIITIGAFLFFFSDMMLVFYNWGGKVIIFDHLCLATYYPAEFILACSLFLVAIFNRKKKVEVIK